MVKKYNKLVRDRIPEIIEASGKTCVTRILSDEDYLRMVDAKLCPVAKEMPDNMKEKLDEYLMRKRPKK